MPSGMLAMGLLTLYVMMISVSVSAVRAYVMLLLKIVADITGRVYDMLTAVMLGLCNDCAISATIFDRWWILHVLRSNLRYCCLVARLATVFFVQV